MTAVKVSMADVARHCGVSVATVSRALDPLNTHPVGAATRQRVLETAADMGYRSNAIGRALRTGRSRLVGVLVHDIRDPYFARYARGISDVARQADYLTMVCSSDRDPDVELAYVRTLRDNRAAGVFFVASGFEDPDVTKQMNTEVDLIRDYGGVAMALSPHPEELPCEMADNIGGARRVVDHLIELGHRRIGLIGGPARMMTSTKREEGYLLALASAGIAVDRSLLARGDFGEESGVIAAQQFIHAQDRPTALFCASDAMAIGCIQELKRAGISVPHHMSVAGFGDIPTARLLEPALTTGAVPLSNIGEAGMRRMLAMLADAESGRSMQDNVIRLHPVPLVVRGTTAPPPDLARR